MMLQRCLLPLLLESTEPLVLYIPQAAHQKQRIIPAFIVDLLGFCIFNFFFSFSASAMAE